MQSTMDPVVMHLGKVLHKRYDETAKEPLPKRWVELLYSFDAKERETCLKHEFLKEKDHGGQS